ncbi:hypothetical protein ABZ612_23230 [Streptomyces avermitilis]|uniref:hypothetical protein n=1 Tax=Streptomyces avermitilis TaxID=33903 RepID=UPI0033D75351
MRGARGPKRETVLGCAVALAVAALLVGFAVADRAWGPDIWRSTAPGWPGGGYGFAATVGVLLPWAAAAAITSFSQVNWRRNRARSLGWSASALAGATLSALLLLVVFAAFRPKKRHRGYDCYREGGACWVHTQYPYVWAVGLAATVAGTALLIGGLFAYVRGRTPNDSPPPTT